jgi:hypothetical protein
VAKSLSDGVFTVMLPDDLKWTNEHSWSPVVQVTERTLTGALVINAGSVTSGQPMTLQSPDENSAWIKKVDLEQLKVWSYSPLQELTLIWPTGTRTVVFNHEQAPIEAELVVDYSDPDPDDFYTITLRLLDVS